MTINWREEICRFLNRSSESTDDEILDGLDTVSTELVALRELNAQQVTEPKPPSYQIINLIRCSQSPINGLYLGVPWVVENGPNGAHLRGSDKINNFELHLERNKEVAFFVYYEFECCYQRSRPTRKSEVKDFLVREYVFNISTKFRQALIEVCNLALKGIAHPDFTDDEVKKFRYPYLWWYHGRRRIEQAKMQISSGSLVYLAIFQDYLDACIGHEWDTVDSLISRGYIKDKYIHYLFIPKDICILNVQGRPTLLLEAFAATDWLHQAERRIVGTKWIFDGNFKQEHTHFTINEFPSDAEELPIQDLSLYPARFAKNEDLDAIRRRGRMFWKCRHRNYVCYKDTKSDGAHSMSDPRFMIDTAVFRQMHPSADGEESVTRDDLGPKVMSQDEPDLPDTFFMCLPTTLSGFNMQKKEWVTLEVGYVQDVTWNEEAFNLLVIDESTKELIQAVITNQLQAEDQADMISGEGNGLFILLHGGPGTGKSLTAESVAEIARKPLYKVTCGDIGTKAEDVEKYLEVVLLLGKTWGCVVLLDEADVFLEQRSLSNLERNALVSVFLRVLEYYDGILILTSNRVGTFDEAFRSRIQLTLRYENLSRTQRHTIWENSFRRLERLDTSRAAPLTSSSPTTRSTSGFGFDFPDIRAHIAELADRNLNGREIRNAISTARQLAMYKREPMSYKHLERVIKETTKFEAYITELNRGFTSDEIAKDTGARL
ncbi:hypothetical protein F5Y08DRAFT_62021 [Xylaria arbuscula]|nr:hypothetical protein F5Y08DRAFT_62021 [Xylaria arbuscula]